MSAPMSTDDLPVCPICFAILDDDGTCPEPENHEDSAWTLLPDQLDSVEIEWTPNEQTHERDS